MSENPVVIKDLGAILRRRKLHVAIPAAFILLFSGALAYLLPPAYVSTATILIEQQEIPKDLVASTVTGYAAERIETVRSRVMTRDNLWSIAEEFDLYPGERSLETQQDIVALMRTKIALNLVSAEALDPRSGRPVTATIAFSLSFESESPELAQQITARLSELYLEENRRSREENAQQTSSFLNDEAQRLSGRIAELEEKIAAFKIRSGGYSPEYFETTSRSLEDAQRQLGLLDARLAPLESRYAYLKSRLTGFGSSSQLARARAELAIAREKYSDIHPDVVRLKRTVETLEAGGDLGGTSYDSAGDPEFVALQSEMQQVGGAIGAVRAERAALNQRIEEYQSRLARSPELEREYSALTRDLNHATGKYSEIRDKLTGAQLAEELEREQKAERFTLIEAATYPSAPSKPNIPAIMLLGLTFALGAGVGVAALSEYLDRRIHGPKELAAVFKAPPLAIIPEIPV